MRFVFHRFYYALDDILRDLRTTPNVIFLPQFLRLANARTASSCSKQKPCWRPGLLILVILRNVCTPHTTLCASPLMLLLLLLLLLSHALPDLTGPMLNFQRILENQTNLKTCISKSVLIAGHNSGPRLTLITQILSGVQRSRDASLGTRFGTSHQCC